MAAIVKTFKSEQPDFFTKPQGLSSFGIIIPGAPQSFTLGLEEFNFCDILNKFTFQGKHVAYLPPYSTFQKKYNPRNYNCLHLMFHNGGKDGVTHYATMHNVSRIPDIPTTIIELRKALTTAGLPNYVNVGSGAWPNYNLYPGSQIAASTIWNRNFNTDRIIEPNPQLKPKNKDRFVVNMFYERITFHNQMPQMKEWETKQRARLFFENDAPACK